MITIESINFISIPVVYETSDYIKIKMLLNIKVAPRKNNTHSQTRGRMCEQECLINS